MLLKSRRMKFITTKITLTLFLLLLTGGIAIAQEVIKDNAVDTIKKTNTRKFIFRYNRNGKSPKS